MAITAVRSDIDGNLANRTSYGEAARQPVCGLISWLLNDQSVPDQVPPDL
jgi:hypothetical protein